MSSQEDLHSSTQQVTTSMEEAKNLKQEVDRLKDQLKTIEKFKKGIEALDKVLSLQRFPSNKSGLGYDQVHMLKVSSLIIQVDDKCCDDTPKEPTMQQKDRQKENTYVQEFAHSPKKSNLKKDRKKKGYYKQEGQKYPKYKSELYGYCFCCNNYGHKSSYCQAYGKHNKMRRNHNPCGPFPNYLIECYNCHNYGHIATRCTTRPPRPRYTKVWRRKY